MPSAELAVGIANLPNQRYVFLRVFFTLNSCLKRDSLIPISRHKIVAKRGAAFTIMLVGTLLIQVS